MTTRPLPEHPAPSVVETTMVDYGLACRIGLRHAVGERPALSAHWWLVVDAASIAYDNAVALHFAGRRPMIASRREVAWA
jgi:hypothetical protein